MCNKLIFLFHLKLIHWLLSEADGKNKLQNGWELVQVQMVATGQVCQGAVEGVAGTIIQSLPLYVVPQW